MNSVVTILVVEDNPGDVFLIRRALKSLKMPYALAVMDDGQSALTYLEDAEREGITPSLILLDLNLPKIGGASVLDGIRQNPRYKGLPVIIMTSSDSPMDHAMVAQLHADHYFRKPRDLDGFMQLGQIVGDFLKTSQEEQTA